MGSEQFHNMQRHSQILWIYEGVGNWVKNMLAHLPTQFDGFKVIPQQMIEEEDRVFVQTNVTATGMDFSAGHFFILKNGKIKEFHIYYDSQKFVDSIKD